MRVVFSQAWNSLFKERLFRQVCRNILSNLKLIRPFAQFFFHNISNCVQEQFNNSTTISSWSPHHNNSCCCYAPRVKVIHRVNPQLVLSRLSGPDQTCWASGGYFTDRYRHQHSNRTYQPPAGIITTSRLIHRSRRHHICIVVSGEGGFGKAPSDLHEECQFVSRAVVFWNFPALYKACADWSIAAGGKSFCDMWLVEDWNGNYDQIISNWRAWDLWQLMKKLPFFVGV